MSAAVKLPHLDPANIASILSRTLGEEEARWIVKRAREEAIIRAAREDPNVFIEYVARDSSTGKPIKQAKIHRMLQRFIPRAEDVEDQWLGLICLPREHGKTTQIRYRDIWEIGRNPTLRLKIVTETDDLGAKIAHSIRAVIEADPYIQKVFPDMKPGRPWTGNKFSVSGALLGENEYTVEQVSVTSAATGGRADLIHFDDVMGPSIIGQPAKMERIKDHFEELFLNLLAPGGRCVYLYTPWHAKDLSAALAESPGWEKFIYPAYKMDSKGRRVYLWPERWNGRRLMKRKESLRNDRVFARQYLLQPISDEEMIFPNEVMRPCMEPDWGYGSPEYNEFVKDMPKYMGVDMASAMSDKSAYNVLLTVGVDDKGRKWIVDLLRGKWRPHEIDEIIFAKWRQYRHRAIIVESNGFQSAVVSRAQDKIGIRTEDGKFKLDNELFAYAASVHAFHTTRVNKHSEELGIRGHAGQMGRGTWAIPVKHLVEMHGFDPENPMGVMAWNLSFCDIDPIATFIREHVEYTATASGGTYTDTVMAAWFVEWAVGDIGLLSDVQEMAARQW